MTDQEIATLTDTELLQKAHRSKNERIFDAVMIGLLVGISAYSAINKGVGLVNFIPLAYLLVAYKNGKKRKMLMAEIQHRGL